MPILDFFLLWSHKPFNHLPSIVVIYKSSAVVNVNLPVCEPVHGSCPAKLCFYTFKPIIYYAAWNNKINHRPSRPSIWKKNKTRDTWLRTNSFEHNLGFFQTGQKEKVSYKNHKNGATNKALSNSESDQMYLYRKIFHSVRSPNSRSTLCQVFQSSGSTACRMTRIEAVVSDNEI